MDFQKRAKEIIDIEIAGMEKVRDQIDGGFTTAIEWILEAEKNGGKVIVTGVGKNFHIGQKMVATFNSTGTKAALLHPIEAMHGDFGVVGEKDIVLALSYSGASDELIALLPALKRQGLKIIGMTADAASPLGVQSDLILPITVDKEACPFGMAPTTSTTVTLALGDALAIVLLEARGFKKEDYAKLHPGGAIGRTLLLKVADVMRTGDRLAKVVSGSKVKEAVMAMTGARSGCVAITDADEKLLGIFTDGDLRRHLMDTPDITEAVIDTIMSANPITLKPEQLAVDLLKIYEEKNIDDLVVVDDEGRVAGTVDIQDLPKLKIL
ncbi:MAG: KpsF/GutQ family sugar-phosphate isomerase [Kiritimatiellales bacterium]|nr:KpsF/GutQ family sugar-phosphate isomerase [Kiritimatiellota bacterium]MBL7012237.1 KpsF/GutQ family sugar-phosphate isomerase [Kiritimatiellales bacterium]